MSNAWSIYIIVLTVVMIIGCTWLLWATARPIKDEGETTGHVWDGDIREYNKPLPRWWLILFYATIIYSIGYLIWYPGLGNFAGISGWTSVKEHDAHRDEAEARLAPLFARFETMPVEEIARDPDGLRRGHRNHGTSRNGCRTPNDPGAGRRDRGRSPRPACSRSARTAVPAVPRPRRDVRRVPSPRSSR